MITLIRIEGGSNYDNKRCATSSSTAPSVDRFDCCCDDHWFGIFWEMFGFSNISPPLKDKREKLYCLVWIIMSIALPPRYCGGTLNCNYDSVSPSMIVTSVIFSFCRFIALFVVSFTALLFSAMLFISRSFVPFELEVSLNPTEKAGTNNRGFCLDYSQIFCG